MVRIVRVFFYLSGVAAAVPPPLVVPSAARPVPLPSGVVALEYVEPVTATTPSARANSRSPTYLRGQLSTASSKSSLGQANLMHAFRNSEGMFRAEPKTSVPSVTWLDQVGAQQEHSTHEFLSSWTKLVGALLFAAISMIAAGRFWRMQTSVLGRKRSTTEMAALDSASSAGVACFPLPDLAETRIAVAAISGESAEGCKVEPISQELAVGGRPATAEGFGDCGFVAGAGLRSASRAPARTNPANSKPRVQLGPFVRDLHLDGYPVHGNGYYWTLSKDTEAVIVYMPIADDVTAKDIIFDCKDWRLKLGVRPEKGELVIDDRPLYKLDVEESYFVLEDGEYNERCAVAYLCKYSKEQDWYAYDRFEAKSERFLLEGEMQRARLVHKISKKCFMDIEIDEQPAGRIVFGLWGDLCPITVENFRCLCTGEHGESKETGHPLHYKGTRLHRIIPGFCVQGGQTFENRDGSGGESIYGRTFEDENLRVQFSKAGMLAMANGGPDTNGSQFFITLCKAKHLDHNSVGFGEVLEGLDLIKSLEQYGDEDGDATKLVVITDCGEIPMDESEQKISEGFANVPLARELERSTEARERLVQDTVAGKNRTLPSAF